MSRPVAILVSFFLLATTAHATSYASFHHREIIVKVDLVVEGKIVAIIGPPESKDDKTPGLSVVVVQIERVFKGDVKPGSKLSFYYCSHLGRFAGDKIPDHYEVGEKLMLALQRSDTSPALKYFVAPKEAGKTPWSNWSPRGIYNKQLQSTEFRSVAECWIEPDKHLKDPKLRRDAVYFLAVQKRLPTKMLLDFLASEDVGDQYAGCLAAGVVKTSVAVTPLIGVIEKHRGLIKKWNDARHEERKKLEPRLHAYEAAQAALNETPIDGAEAGPALLRLARWGEMERSLPNRLLRAGPARWHVWRGLRQDDHRAVCIEALYVLHALDARAAYEPIRKLAKIGPARYLVKKYQNEWSQRLALHSTRELGGYSDDEEWSIIRKCFGFTHEPLDDKTGKGWQDASARIRRSAERQFELTEKKGPSFAELPARLAWPTKWEAHKVDAAGFANLSKAQQKELTALIVKHADPKAAGLDANAEAAWFVDLYAPDYSHDPVGQLWVAADGAFGLGWLPDRAWGKSVAIVAFLENLKK